MGKGMTKTMRILRKNTKKSRKYRKKQLSFRRGGVKSSISEKEKEKEPVPDKVEPDEKKESPPEEVKDKLQLTQEEAEEMIGFKKVIDVFLKKEKTTPTLKYAMNQSNFEKYSSPDTRREPREEYELTRDLTHLIIKDDAHNMFFDAEVASFQVLIDNMYKFLTSFQSVQHDLKIDYYFKSLVNDKPFVRVTHNVNGYNTIHDVNNLLAYIQNEYNKKKTIEKTHSDKTFIFHGNKV